MKFKNSSLWITFICLLLVQLKSFGQEGIYKKIKIYGSTNDLQALMKKGVCIDHGESKLDCWFSSYFNENETKIIKASGLKYDIEIEDAVAYHKKAELDHLVSKVAINNICPNINSKEYTIPTHFKTGTMAGFYTYQEMLDDLDSMALLYPNLITIKKSIDSTMQTWEGRPIYYVKISDNPNIDEAEPEVYYSAMHHAREPGSMQQLMFYMWYLLENYQNDSLCAGIVNNRELYFIPCLNPDGYLYNEFTNPTGYGYWRKNRRDNLDGEFGVDLNRNYDTFWGYDDIGSSPFTNSNVYRGPSPGSEPEIMMVKNFINSRQFKVAMDNHTYGGYVLYPWGHVPDFYTPDSSYYEAIANVLTEQNDYLYGTVNQTLNYVSNGGSFDWLYGEQISKPKIFDFTPEFGYDFWPLQSDIIPIIQEAMYNNFITALVAGPFGKTYDKSTPYLKNTSGYINYDFSQLGLDTIANYTVSLTSLSPLVISTGAPKIYTNLNFFQTINDSIEYTLNSGITNGTEIKFILNVSYGNYQISDTLVKYFGNPSIIFNDSGNITSNFNLGSFWDLTTEKFHSPPTSFTDSPFSNYTPFVNDDLKILNPFNLTSALKAGFSFYARWRIESKFDYAEVLASIDNGITWTPLCGKYTKPGSFFQDLDQPLYDGTQNSWVKEEISLNDFIGNNVFIKFKIVSDSQNEFDGIYIDDIDAWAISSNVGLNENSKNIEIINIYPNPANETATLNYKINNGEYFEVEIVNSLGKVIRRLPINSLNNSLQIDLKNLASGSYLCQIISDSRVFETKQLIVIK